MLTKEVDRRNHKFLTDLKAELAALTSAMQNVQLTVEQIRTDQTQDRARVDNLEANFRAPVAETSRASSRTRPHSPAPSQCSDGQLLC